MFAAVCIALSVALLAGVRHEPALRSWAMSPRTPGRVAARVTQGVRATGGAVATATLLAGGATILVFSFLGSIDQAAGAL